MHEQSRFISDERAIEARRLWGRQRETGVMEMLSWFTLPSPMVCLPSGLLVYWLQRREHNCKQL